MRTVSIFLIVITLALTVHADDNAFRTWSDASGSFKLEAQLVKQTGDSVTLRRKDGKEVTLPLVKLSKSDQEFLRNPSGSKSEKSFGFATLPPARPLGAAKVINDLSADVQPLPAEEKTPPMLAVPMLGELTADPAKGVMATKNYGVAFTDIDAYDKVSQPFCIDLSGGVAIVSIGRHVAGQKESRGRIYRAGYGIKKAELLVDVPETVDILAHDRQSGRTLLVVGRDELYRGGDLVLIEGVIDGTVKVICRRSMPGIEKPGFKPNADWASLSGDLAIVQIDSKLYGWNLIDNRLVYQHALNSGEKTAISPGGKYVAIGGNSKVVMLDAASGEPLGQFSTGTTLIPQLMFDPTGEKLAIAMDNRLDVWNLAAAEHESQLTLFSPIGVMLGWVQPELMLTTLAGLVDLELEMTVWNYSFLHADRCQTTEGGLLICDEQKNFLVMSTLPVPHAPANRLRTRLNGGVAKDMVVQPGSAVSIRIESKQPVDVEAITSALQSVAEKAGWTVKPKAPIELVAVIGRGEKQSLSYRMSKDVTGLGGRDETATITPFTSELQIQRGGKILWSRKTSNYVPSILFMRDGQTLQQEVSKFEKPDPTFFENLNLPPRIINPDLLKSMGRSRLTESGWAE